jgi:hypothetical protein
VEGQNGRAHVSSTVPVPLRWTEWKGVKSGRGGEGGDAGCRGAEGTQWSSFQRAAHATASSRRDLQGVG